MEHSEIIDVMASMGERIVELKKRLDEEAKSSSNWFAWYQEEAKKRNEAENKLTEASVKIQSLEIELNDLKSTLGARILSAEGEAS
jgi:DNA repair exonuclease SbcCD ATPase subunit